MNGGKRVVITGIGVVTSIGIGVDEFLIGLRKGRSGVKPVTSFDTTGFAYANACEITDFEVDDLVERIDPAQYGRAGQMSAAAGRMAVRDAGLPEAAVRARSALVSVGTTNGESRDFDRLSGQHVATGSAGLDPALTRRVGAVRLASSIVRELDLVDVETVTIPTACAAGNYAIGYGYDALSGGEVDIALCGGADALCRKTFAGFYRLGTIAPEVCQPFDVNRKGILTGEGAAVLVMETMDSALARGARIYAEVLGYALNCDAHHAVAPDRDSIAECMRLAHRSAGVDATQIDFISAHGTGTRANDVTEAGAIRQVFGQTPPPTISTKAMLGHTMGAASAIASAACALALAEGFIPPTTNHVETDPECGLDCVPNEARDADLRVVQNNALAFGGNNAVVIFSKVGEQG